MSGTDSHLAIVNPAAGGGRCGAKFPAVLERLTSAGIEVDVEHTAAAGQASEIARDAYRAGRRRFIAVGGDGTSFEIVNGLFPDAEDARPEERPILGFLPLGTGNSFLRDFSDRGADHAVESIIANRRRRSDVLRLHHKDGVYHYINIGGVGFAAQVNARRMHEYARWGQLGYAAAVVAETLTLRGHHFNIRVEDEDVDDAPLAFACFNNSKYTGGTMKMCPHANTSDGKIAYLRVAAMDRLALLTTFPKVYRGRHLDHPAVTARNVERMTFDLDHSVDVLLDGESVHVTPTKVDVLAGALLVQA